MIEGLSSTNDQDMDKQFSSSTQDSITNEIQNINIENSKESLNRKGSLNFISQESSNNDQVSKQSLRNYGQSDDQTIKKYNRKGEKPNAEYHQKILNHSQNLLIVQLKQKNIKFTKDYLDIIVVKLEEKQYFIESYLTSGGQSDIYQGYLKSPQGYQIFERVYKIIKSDSVDFNEQMNEYNLLKTIQHPMNIIQYYDAIQIEEHCICIFIIEQCQCSLEDELRQMIENHANFTIPQLFQIIFDLIDGLIELRANNIIHQDIKPQNILKTKAGKYVYSDFGISGKLKDNQVEVKGFTPYFCPPEQVTQQALFNYKGDIYSLGKTFLRLIQFYQNCKEINQDSPLLEKLIEIIESCMINHQQNDRVDCLDLIQAIYDIVLINDLKEVSAIYLEKIKSIISLNKFDNTKDIPFLFKAKKVYSFLLLQITLHLGNIIIMKDQIMLSQISDLLIKLVSNQSVSKNIPDSLQQLSICFFDLGEYENALQFQLQSLNLYKKFFGGNQEQIASSYNNIGELYAALGQTQTALDFQLKSLEINQTLYKNNHPSISISLNNIGKRYAELGDYQKALTYQQKSLKMRKILYKKNHMSIANSLNNIGALYSKLGDIKEAFKFQFEALQMYKQTFEGNHPDIAACLNNVGKRYDELGDPQQAIFYLSESLDMHRQLYNPTHHIIATSLNNLASIYAKLGQPQKALYLQLESLDIKQQIYPINHPKISQLYHNIGQRYAELSKPNQGLKYQLKSLEMRKQYFKGNNLYIAQSLDSLGERYAEIKEYQKALQYQKEALDMRKALLKGNHMCIASSLENVGERYTQLGDSQTALNYQLQSLKMYKKIYHGDNVYIATSLNNIGKRYDEINDIENALKYQLMSLDMRKRIHKSNHPSIAQSLNNIGEKYSKLGNIQTGLEYQLKSLEIYQSIYNYSHPYVTTLLKNISNKYILLGEEDKAQQYQQQYFEAKNPLTKPMSFIKSSSSDLKDRGQQIISELYKSF